MTLLYQASNVRAPQYRTTDSDGTGPVAYSSQILYDVTILSQAHELPERFWGKYVRLQPSIAIDFLFSDNPAQSVNNAVVATAAGAVSASLGGKCAADTAREFRVPTPPPNGKIYFARVAGGNGNVLIELASD